MNGLVARGVSLGTRLSPTDLALAPGTLTALAGPNGAGKTSFIHALARIGDAGGDVAVDGRRIESIPPAHRARWIGYAAASREIAWPMRVRDLVRLTAPEAGAEEVDMLLADWSLSEQAERRADRLSTGERTRLLIARALLARPRVLLLDEPFANLDPGWQIALAERLEAEARRGTVVLFSAHDLALAARIAGRLILIGEGAIVADGPPAALGKDIVRLFGVVPGPDGGWRRA